MLEKITASKCGGKNWNTLSRLFRQKLRERVSEVSRTNYRCPSANAKEVEDVFSVFGDPVGQGEVNRMILGVIIEVDLDNGTPGKIGRAVAANERI